MANLKEIINRCSRGDREAQSLLYRRFAGKMFSVCKRYSKNDAEAEDNLQDGFIKIFSRIKQYSFSGSFEGWMRRVIVNSIFEKYRKKKNVHAVEDISVHEKEELRNDIVGKMSADDLMRLIQELPPRYRMAFNLYAIEGYSHKEIAQAMGISEGTSKSNLSRARAILQKKVVFEFGYERLEAK